MERIMLGNVTGSTRIPIGIGLPTRIIVIVGITKNQVKEQRVKETRKVDIAAKLGADTITDLSMVRLNRPIWQYVKERYPKMGAGINPVYLPYVEGRTRIDPTALLAEIVSFAEKGGDQMTINFFPQTRSELETYASGRRIPITSRQGGLLAVCMRKHTTNNPFWMILKELLDVCRRFRVTVNLGATFRPAGIAEANDLAHRWELGKLLEMHRIFDEAGVQSVVEGISHHPYGDIGALLQRLRQEYGRYVTFQALGPVVTDIENAQEDHVTAAIGAAEAARHNVGKITTIPPREHTGYPDLRDTERGIIATVLAVHAGDMARIPGLITQDEAVLEHRARFHTCDQLKTKQGCEKCAQFCPLVIANAVTKQD